jgi:post-segregation antitoxin (ccd killing protein)
MGSRLVNVRLDEDRLRKARRLRAHGLTLSDVVREAIDARFAAVERTRDAGEVRAVMAEILAQYPDPPGSRPRAYDVHDSAAARAAITRRLKRRPR